MPDQLSDDLASLKIERTDRSATSQKTGQRSPRGRNERSRGPALSVLAAAGAAWGMYVGYPHVMEALRGQVLRTDVELAEIVSVSPATTAVELTSSGYVVPQQVSRVGAQVAGRVRAVHVRQGQKVEQGAVVVELEDIDHRAAVRAAEAQVHAAQARVHTARAEAAEVRIQAERKGVLANRGAVAAAEVEDLRARLTSLGEAVKAAEAEVDAARAEAALRQVDLAFSTIRAPLAGTITNRPPEVGEIMDPREKGQGVEISNLASMMVESDIPEARLHLVKLGAPCEIVLDAFPSRRFRGEAAEVVPQVDRAKATVMVKVDFLDDITGVLPDMSARVSFLSAPLDQNALQEGPKTVVPRSAVAERSGAQVVFVVENERVRQRAVQLGDELGSGLELLEGPGPGAQVVRNPPATLQDGQRVQELE